MKNLIATILLGACMFQSSTMAREMYDACEPNEPDTCDQVGEKGGCCMVWDAKYHSTNNFLFVEVGRQYKQCVNKSMKDYILSRDDGIFNIRDIQKFAYDQNIDG